MKDIAKRSGALLGLIFSTLVPASLGCGTLGNFVFYVYFLLKFEIECGLVSD